MITLDWAIIGRVVTGITTIIISTIITIGGATRRLHRVRQKLEAQRRALPHSSIEGRTPPITTLLLRAGRLGLKSRIRALVTPLQTAKAREVIIQLHQASLMHNPCMAIGVQVARKRTATATVENTQDRSEVMEPDDPGVEAEVQSALAHRQKKP